MYIRPRYSPISPNTIIWALAQNKITAMRLAQPGSPLVSPRGDPGAPSFDGRESDGLLTGTSLPSIGSAADLDLMSKEMIRLVG